jgi:hypothetical protein
MFNWLQKMAYSIKISDLNGITKLRANRSVQDIIRGKRHNTIPVDDLMETMALYNLYPVEHINSWKDKFIESTGRVGIPLKSEDSQMSAVLVIHWMLLDDGTYEITAKIP